MPHRVLSALPDVIPEHRAKRKSQVLPGVVLQQQQEEQIVFMPINFFSHSHIIGFPD